MRYHTDLFLSFHRMIVQIVTGEYGPAAITAEGDVFFLTRRTSTGEIVTTKDIVERDPGEDQRMMRVRVSHRTHPAVEELTEELLRSIHEANVAELRSA